MRYTGFKCPVCDCNFTETDDVVVCPECGTPHHRICWKEKGECANTHKHTEGYVWSLNKEKGENENNEADFSQNRQENSQTVKVCPRCGLPNAGDESTCIRCGERLYSFGDNQNNNPDFSNNPKGDSSNSFAPFNPFSSNNQQPPKQSYEYKNPYAESAENIYGDKQIEDIPVTEYAEYIQKNNNTYIQAFDVSDGKKNKITWNWASALFGPFWLFYRKIMGAGLALCILIFSCQTISTLLVQNYFEKYRPEIYTQYTDSYEEFLKFYEDYQNGVKTEISPDETLTLLKNVTTNKMILAVESVKLAIYLVSFIVMGFLGNTLYKKKVIKSIKKMREVAVDDRTYRFVLRTSGGTSVINLILPIVLNSAFDMILQIF